MSDDVDLPSTERPPRPPTAIVAMACYAGVPSLETVMSLATIGERVAVVKVERVSCVALARNRALTAALQLALQSGAPVVVCIDDDMVFSSETFGRLVRLASDLGRPVSGMYATAHGTLAARQAPDLVPIQVDGMERTAWLTGGGMLAIPTSLLEEIAAEVGTIREQTGSFHPFCRAGVRATDSRGNILSEPTWESEDYALSRVLGGVHLAPLGVGHVKPIVIWPDAETVRRVREGEGLETIVEGVPLERVAAGGRSDQAEIEGHLEVLGYPPTPSPRRIQWAPQDQERRDTELMFEARRQADERELDELLELMLTKIELEQPEGVERPVKELEQQARRELELFRTQLIMARERRFDLGVSPGSVSARSSYDAALEQEQVARMVCAELRGSVEAEIIRLRSTHRAGRLWPTPPGEHARLSGRLQELEEVWAMVPEPYEGQRQEDEPAEEYDRRRDDELCAAIQSGWERVRVLEEEAGHAAWPAPLSPATALLAELEGCRRRRYLAQWHLAAALEVAREQGSGIEESEQWREREEGPVVTRLGAEIEVRLRALGILARLGAREDELRAAAAAPAVRPEGTALERAGGEMLTCSPWSLERVCEPVGGYSDVSAVLAAAERSEHEGAPGGVRSPTTACASMG